jgi:hypothetical protein
MIDSNFVQAISTLSGGQSVTVNGKEYTTKQVYNVPLPTEPLTPVLAVSTLTGLVDFCKTITPNNHILHVKSFHEVVLLSAIQGEARQREAFISANCGGPSFKFGQFIDQQEFMIAIQSQFTDYGDRAKVMRVIGTIKQDQAKTSMDDGITQVVTASKGVTLVADVAVPNPVLLKPYRTFGEVDQPPSQFVLRVDEDTVALFESDGGLWKREAINNIREYLASKVTGIPIIA